MFRHSSRFCCVVNRVRSHCCVDLTSSFWLCGLTCKWNDGNLGLLRWTSSHRSHVACWLGRKRTSSTSFGIRCFASRWRSNVCFLVLTSSHHFGLFLVSPDLGLLFEKDFVFVFGIVFVFTIERCAISPVIRSDSRW